MGRLGHLLGQCCPLLVKRDGETKVLIKCGIFPFCCGYQKLFSYCPFSFTQPCEPSRISLLGSLWPSVFGAVAAMDRAAAGLLVGQSQPLAAVAGVWPMVTDSCRYVQCSHC